MPSVWRHDLLTLTRPFELRSACVTERRPIDFEKSAGREAIAASLHPLSHGAARFETRRVPCRQSILDAIACRVL